MKSPPRGSSTLITSAPISPSSPAQNGALMRVPTSMTRTPSSGSDRPPAQSRVSLMFAPAAASPSTRSPRIVRWISFVPAHTLDAW